MEVSALGKVVGVGGLPLPHLRHGLISCTRRDVGGHCDEELHDASLPRLLETQEISRRATARIDASSLQPFYTTKAVDEGIGIGLDLAWRVIVDKHGGTLTVESNDTGTRIIARLPVNGPVGSS